MIRCTPGSTRTRTLFPYAVLLRAHGWRRDRRGARRRSLSSSLDSPPSPRVQGAFRRQPKMDAAAMDGSAVPFHESRRPYGTTILKRGRSEEHTSELQSLMRISYAVFCLKKNK